MDELHGTFEIETERLENILNRIIAFVSFPVEHISVDFQMLHEADDGTSNEREAKSEP